MPAMNELACVITTTTTGTGISTMEMSIIKRCLPVEEGVGVR